MLVCKVETCPFNVKLTDSIRYCSNRLPVVDKDGVCKHLKIGFKLPVEKWEKEYITLIDTEPITNKAE